MTKIRLPNGDKITSLTSLLSKENFYYPLWILFRRSLDDGIIPPMLKFCSVTPVLEPHNPTIHFTIVSDCRPISIQSYISKMFRSLVLNALQLYSYGGATRFSSNAFYHYLCHLVFKNYVYESFHNRSQIDVIYADFNKTFDPMNHFAFIHVHNESGLCESLLSWFKSDFCDRYHFVKLFGIKFNLSMGSLGMPQGGRLSPLFSHYLFIEFIVFFVTIVFSILLMILNFT